MALSKNTHWVTVGLLGAFFVLALALRILFNVGVAYDDAGERYLYSGNDPWYHDRTVEYIVENGESLKFDPAINYPEGGRNPNPPLYDWTTALDAKILEATGASDPVGLSLNLAVGFWGALTIFPIFMLARDLWGRNAGLWAAFFMAVSAPHIQRSVFGFADHDATTLFWIALSFAFLVRALKVLRAKEYVPSWRDGAMEGMRKGFAENKEALLWSALSGVAMAATALTWKGYPYALAIMAIGLGLQLLVDHARNKDSTVVAAIYLIPVLLTLVISWPYYSELGFMRSTVSPNLYVLVGMLVATVILVPTRDMPSIVVFPAIILAGILGLLVLLFVVPSVGNQIFTGLGYFRQTKLYSTIAEAQRTELGFVAANFGFFLFLLALWAYGRTIRRAWRGEHTAMLMFAWATVAGFLAFAASRFVMHAAPVFMILGGAATSWIVAKAGFAEVAKRRRQRHGQGSALGNSVKSMTGKSTGVTLLVAVFLVLPNVWLGVDAAMSSEFERDNGLSADRLGAFGIGFDVQSSGWLELFDELAARDQELPLEDRPAFMGWWDYGHWATAIGKHPTVADPFQNHFEIAGRFLASETEENAMRYLSILLVNGELRRADMSPATAAVLSSYGLDPQGYGGDYDDKLDYFMDVDDEDVFSLYDDLSEATGKTVGYLGVDSRMFPINVQNSGIFYAPVFLANKNPDDFVKISYQGSGVLIDAIQYEVDENGDSYRLAEPRFEDQNGDPWVVSGQAAYPGKRIPLSGGVEPITVQPTLSTTERFQNSMYTRAFGSLDPSVPAGEGLTHWRLIHQSLQGEDPEFRTTALLQYYKGHEVSGRLVGEDGAPLSGLTVTFVDEFGAGHDAMTTGADGTFSVLAPFGDLKLTVRAGGEDVYTMDWQQDIADDGGSTDGVEVTVPRGEVTGRAFEDTDADGDFTEGTDTPIAGADVDLGGRSATTAADGTFSFNGVSVGNQQVVVTKDGYQDGGVFVTVLAGEPAEAKVIMAPEPSTFTLTFTDDGEAVQTAPVRLSGTVDRTLTTNVNGTATTLLPPGDYDLVIDHTVTRDGVEVVYDERRSFTVPFGGADFDLTIAV